MLPCHSLYIYGTWRSKEEGGGLKVLIWREAKGGRYKVKRGFLGGAMTPQLFYQNYLHIWHFLV